MGCKSAITSMEINVDLWFDGSHSLDDPERYRRLIKKLIYLKVTRLDIIFIIGVLSRFMHQPRETHWTTVLRILSYVKSFPCKGLLYRKYGHLSIFGDSNFDYAGDKRDRKSTTGYCTLLEKIL